MWNEIRTKLGLNNQAREQDRNVQAQRSADNWQAARAGGSQASSGSNASSAFGSGAAAGSNQTSSSSGINSVNAIKRDPKKTTTENALTKHRHNWYADPTTLIEASLTDKWDSRKQMYPEDVSVPNKTKVTYSRLASYVSTLSDEDREAALNDLRAHGA